MRVRDLPRDLLLTYTSEILSSELPAAWIDLDVILFLAWLERARANRAETLARWEHIQSLHYQAAALLVPVLERCPSFTMQEAAEMLPAAEQTRCVELLMEIVSSQ